LVYTSSDRVNIPRVNDLRAIALQKWLKRKHYLQMGL
jgi:hypothetical protein